MVGVTSLKKQKLKMKNEKKKIFFKKNWVLLLLLLFLTVNIISIDKSRENIELKNDKKALTNTYQKINNKVTLLKTALMDFEKNDSMFRNVLGVNEIPYDRNGGFGGVERYKNIFLFDEDLESFIKDSYLNVDKFETRLKIQKESYNELSDYVNELEYIPYRSPISTIDLNRITSGYGYRKHPITKKIDFHDGIDLDTEYGADIYSPGKGIVTMKIYSRIGYGNRLVINHQNGYKTLYAHLSNFNVELGDTVDVDDVIAYVGSTGLSTGSHLHYEIYYNDKTLDPLNLITLK